MRLTLNELAEIQDELSKSDRISGAKAHKLLAALGAEKISEDHSLSMFQQWQAAVAEEFRLRQLAREEMNCGYCHNHAEKPHAHAVIGHCALCSLELCTECVSEESPHHHSTCLPSEDDYRAER